MKLLKNRKGFTLVELLAVIVVLAIIILIAMPSVMSAMDKARKNSLVTEIAEIGKIAQTAYADDSMGTGVTSICYNLKYLVENGYLDKKLDDYTGAVYLSVNPNTGKVSSQITISNGIYSYTGAITDAATDKLKSGAEVNNDCSNFGASENKVLK
jgi:type IV pilus assembly protein PilA